MRTQLRIVAGSLRGRRISVTVAPELRPMPQMVREALFSILGNAVPDRLFYDLFAGTGAVGLEAISRGARGVTFVERDPRAAGEIHRHLGAFGVADRATVLRTDTYRWADHWAAPREPVNLFLGPPFPDYQHRLDDLLRIVGVLQEKAAPSSVLVLQGEQTFPFDELPDAVRWEQRRYGRNWLLIWVKEPPAEPTEAP
jgi:16S rRNA (guanine(966)-N(2))-methyltransferase RsmD